ncbi:MAG: Trm112 family protein [Pseudomonadota bacterium]|nr:Trm112 family protein [Pseudomonadota bacterium]MEC7734692.1 Trm112 family protein [Pseudomonadota bacterium]MEC9392361.1 Trm112 family protein [Pseudomonadota bacterium]MEC9458600.1 Trm112 family protein [Pseudomonadota bacterium]MED5437388.1 Trm112 family protein [Pseudomonadota bacterium]
MTQEIDEKLLDILVCPLTKDKLVLDKKNNELISKAAGLAYPIKDGIPIMLPDEARKIN